MPCVRPVTALEGDVDDLSGGVSLTTTYRISTRSRFTPAMTIKACRHPMALTNRTRGVAAAMFPTVPMEKITPVRVAKGSGAEPDGHKLQGTHKIAGHTHAQEGAAHQTKPNGMGTGKDEGASNTEKREARHHSPWADPVEKNS